MARRPVALRHLLPRLVPAAFMKCKAEKRDPKLCLAEGQAVTDCTYGLISELHRKAPREFDEYAQVNPKGGRPSA